MNELTEKQRKLLDTLSTFELANNLEEILYWEYEGFGDLTISEMIARILEEIEIQRHKGEPS